MGSYGSTARISKTSSRESRISRSESTLSKSSVTSEGSTICGSDFSYSREETGSIEKPIDPMEAPEINEVNVVFVKYPDECCPKCCVKRCACCEMFIKSSIGRKWWTFRCYMFKLVEHKYFETFIIGMICSSSLALVRVCHIFPILSCILFGIYTPGLESKSLYFCYLVL